MAKRAHSWRSRLFCGIWPVCARCGLIWLKNRASAKAASKACPDDD